MPSSIDFGLDSTRELMSIHFVNDDGYDTRANQSFSSQGMRLVCLFEQKVKRIRKSSKR